MLTVNKFSKLAKDGNLTLLQIYSMNETRLFWHCLPRNTLVVADKHSMSGMKEEKERVIMLVCNHGWQTCNLFMIGKNIHPRALKGVQVLPVIFRGNKWA